MSWVCTSDDAPEHPKLIGLDDAAYALWHRALSYCNRQLTDGFVPAGALVALSRAPKPADVAKALVAAKLWETAEGGFMVHDYLDYQPSRAEVEEERRKKSEAKQKAGAAGGKRSGETRKQKRSREEAEAKQRTSTPPSTGQSDHQAGSKQNEAPDPDPVFERENPPTPRALDAERTEDAEGSAKGSLAGIWPKDPPSDRAPKLGVVEVEAMVREAMGRTGELTPWQRGQLTKIHGRIVAACPITAEQAAIVVEIDAALHAATSATQPPLPKLAPPPTRQATPAPDVDTRGAISNLLTRLADGGTDAPAA